MAAASSTGPATDNFTDSLTKDLATSRAAPASGWVTRFAPSPTGFLHLGHAHAALFAWQAATKTGGRFLVRIEDIDRGRCRPAFEAALLEDLAWLGLTWDQPVRRQSDHFDEYRAACDELRALGVLYPCFCTRAEIAEAGRAPQGPDGPLYPGTCRTLPAIEAAARVDAGRPYALRLDVARAHARTGPLTWTDLGAGVQTAAPRLGDVVLARKDVPTSYHLSVTLDDARQGITLVTRGVDLMPSTALHRLLQALLGLTTPLYHHHRLLTDPQGRRLAKRDGAQSLRSLRDAGFSPAQVREMAAMAGR